MRKTILAGVGCMLLCAAAPRPALAWGSLGHRLIMARAIDLLPPPLEPFFEAARDELIVRVVDPDLWRTAGWNDDANHFLNLGLAELGPDPFLALPREYGAALEKFGPGGLERIGTVPWREAEMFGHLRRAFEAAQRHRPYAASDIVLFAAASAHYLQDAYQPLHATNNYDGQLSGQSGLHARFESELIERFAPRLTIAPVPAAPIGSPRDATFDVLLASHRLVGGILAADKAARAPARRYDDPYFERFFAAIEPLLARRLGEAAAATAALIVGAWEQAGRPAMPPAPRPLGASGPSARQ
ncbi:MAG: hypothetical protein IT176_09350 [Acidobacteria bacterium]|nr:hypothetical protein [Acidobacteriota bacterium]